MANDPDIETAEQSAVILMVASCLWSLKWHGDKYPQDMLKPAPKRLREFFTEELESAILSAKQSNLLENLRRFKVAPDGDDYMAALLGAMLIASMAIKKQLQCADDETHARAQELCPKRLKDAIQSLHEVMLFDFQIPSPAGLSEYESKERFFFLLGKYWEVYRAYLSHYMTAEGGYSPDPLTRFIVNLRARIRVCLARLGNPEISNSFSELLNIQLDEDASMYDDWIKERLKVVDQEIENERLQFGSIHFDLTAQEELFLEAATRALENVNKNVKAWFADLLKRTKKQESERQNAGGRLDPHVAVGKVETALRGIVGKETQVRFKAGWCDFVKKTIGLEAYEEATKRMAERGITNPNELLHFLYLKDLRTIISVEWSMFNGHFSIPKKRWNVLMDVVVKGSVSAGQKLPSFRRPECPTFEAPGKGQCPAAGGLDRLGTT